MKPINIEVSDERWLRLKSIADQLGFSVEGLLCRVAENISHEYQKSFTPFETKNRVFIDTNVLALIVGNTSLGNFLIKHLDDAGIEAVTFSKCVYELYSLLKGTTKDRRGKKSTNNHPLKRFLQPEINDIAQKLFKKTFKDHNSNAYYWFNLCEEWTWSDYFESYEEFIENYCSQSGKEEAREMLSLQKEFLKWKMALRQAFLDVNQEIFAKGVTIFHYFEVFDSSWYRYEGFMWEQTFAQDSLLPNEDFELVLAAIALQAKAFITRDDNDLIWRGGLSLGLNSPNLSFCCPEKIQEAIATDFQFRFYRNSQNPE